MAVVSVKEAQKNYKKQYDKKSTVIDYKLGDWVFVHLPDSFIRIRYVCKAV